MHVYGLADLKNGGQTAALTPIKNFSSGIGRIICNTRYALVFVNGHFGALRLEVELLKRTGIVVSATTTRSAGPP